MLKKRLFLNLLLICAILISSLPTFSPTPAYAAAISGWFFNNDDNTEGWGIGADLNNTSVKNGILQFITSGSQPRTNYLSVNLNAASTPYLNVKIRKNPVNSSGENLKVYFTTNSETSPDESKTMSVQFIKDTNCHIYSLKMADNVKWSGTIKSIRLVFGNISNSTIDIDSIYFTSTAESDINPAMQTTSVVSSHESGQISTGTSIALNTIDPDARIYYTTDGSDPGISDTQQSYLGPINIQSNTTIKTYAVSFGMADSSVSTFSYSIPGVVSAVQANLSSGIVTPGTEVYLYSDTVSSAIYYTLDGSDPITSEERLEYTTPIVIENTTTIKAYATAPGDTDSLVSTFTYTIIGTTAPVIANPAPGAVAVGTEVELSTTTTSAAIYYTTDNSDPSLSTSRQLYVQPIIINNSINIKAYATASGLLDSNVSELSYFVLPAWNFEQNGDSEGWTATADFSEFVVNGGILRTTTKGVQPRTNYQVIQQSAASIPYLVIKLKKNSINSSGEKLKLYFTTDQEGTADERKTVTANLINDPYWHVYSFDMEANSLWSGTIKSLRLTFQNAVNGDVEIDSIYFSTEPVADIPPNLDVTAMPGGGVVPVGTKVTLTSKMPDAVIYYTLDGSNPVVSETRQIYAEPITIENNVTIKTYSDSPSTGQSEVTICTYRIVRKDWNFEGTLGGWKPGGAGTALEITPLLGRNETNALKIQLSNVTSGYSASDRYEVLGDTYYTFEAYVNIPEGLQGLPYYGNVGLNIVEFNQAGTSLVIDTKYAVNSTNGWTLLSMTIKTKPTASQVQLRLTATGSGSLYMDDVVFREASPLEHKRLREYSGTMAEKVILNGTDAIPAEKPMTINVVTEVPTGETSDFSMNLFWEHESAYYPGSYQGGMLTLFPRPEKSIDNVSLWLRVNAIEGSPTLELRFRELGEIGLDDNWGKIINLTEYAGQGWVFIEIPKSAFQLNTTGMGKGDPNFNNVERLYSLVNGSKGSKVDMNMAGLRFGFEDNTQMMIIDPQRGDYQFDVEAHPEWSNPIDSTGKVVIGMNTRYTTSEKGQQTLLSLKNKLFPNLFISGNTSLNYMSGVRNWMMENGIGIGLQLGHSFGLNNTLTHQNAWGYNYAGESRNLTPGAGGTSQMNHGNDYLHPEYINAFKSAIDKVAGLKISEIQIIDHRITVMNGELAHSEVDRAKYREMLKETDSGIEFTKVDGTTETIKFWEYFRRFNGFVYTPAELDLSDWNEYTPLTATKVANSLSSDKDRINYYIFLHLTKYALLQVTQEFGSYADSKGTAVSIVPTGEGYNNGIDALGLYQATHMPIIAWEFFRSPLQVKDLYMESKYITSSLEKQNKNLRIVTEIGHNGGGSPYYAPELAYITHYDASAAFGAKSLEDDFLEDSFYDRYFDPENYPDNFARVLDLYQKGVAFNHAYQDKAVANTDKQEQVVVLRRPSGNFVRTEEPFQLYNAIRALNVPAISMKYEEFEDLADSAKVLVNDYSAQPHDLKARLLSWIDGKTERSLVMHSFGPGIKMSGTNYSTIWNWNWTDITNPDYYKDVFGSDLGLDSSKAKAGTLETSLPGWAETVPSTLTEDIPGGLYTGGGNEVIVTLNGDPLVSRTVRPNGNYIYYLHYKPNQAATVELDKGIMNAIMHSQGVSMMVEDAAGLVVNGYTKNDGVALYTIYDINSLSGTPDVFPYIASSVSKTFKVRPSNPTLEWLVYDIFSDTLTETNKAEDGTVNLSLNGVSAAMQYLIPKQDGWQNKLGQLRTRRAEIYKLLNNNIDLVSPEVFGVENGKSYNQNVTVSFNEGTATLNGQIFANGGTISADGAYVLVVTDSAGNITTVEFIIDKTEPIQNSGSNLPAEKGDYSKIIENTINEVSQGDLDHREIVKKVKSIIEEISTSNNQFVMSADTAVTGKMKELIKDALEQISTINGRDIQLGGEEILRNTIALIGEYLNIIKKNQAKINLDYEELISNMRGITMLLDESADNNGKLVFPQSVRQVIVDNNLNLTVKNKDVSISFPVEVLNSIDLGSDTSNEKMQFSIAGVDNAKMQEIMKAALSQGDGDMRLSSGLQDLKVSILSEEGERKIDNFSDLIPVELSYKNMNLSNLSEDKLGAYWYNPESKTWEYMGGKIDKAQKKVVFKTRHFSVYAIFEFNKTFSDISNHWAKSDIEILTARHITSGISTDKFDPAGKLTRAQFATFIAKALNLEQGEYSNAFTDVKAGEWYTPAVEAVYKAGIISGTGNGNFVPEQEITLEQMTIMIMKAYEYSTGTKVEAIEKDPKVPFTDMKSISPWAVDMVKAAYSMGIVSGMSDKTFKAKNTASRAEAAKMLVNFLELMN